MILGGSNGDILTEEFSIIDFKEETVLQKQTNFEFCTAMGKLCFSESKNTVHHVGGLNSEGVDFSIELGQTEWQEREQNHSVLLNERGLEFCHSTCLYFK